MVLRTLIFYEELLSEIYCFSESFENFSAIPTRSVFISKEIGHFGQKFDKNMIHQLCNQNDSETVQYETSF